MITSSRAHSINKESHYLENKEVKYREAKNRYKKCQYDNTTINFHIFCEKCKFRNTSRTKQFDKFGSVYQHLLYYHSENDKLEYPSRDYCIARLHIVLNSVEDGKLTEKALQSPVIVELLKRGVIRL